MVEKIKVLITGSNGMLASSLALVLTRQFQVTGIDIDNCDITDKDAILNKIKYCNPAIVIHAAAYTDVDGSQLNPDKAFAVNVSGTENIVRALNGLDTVLFYISTDYVFNGSKNSAYLETDAPDPINAYGRSKLEGERAVQEFLTKYFILRTSGLFGQNGKNFITAILAKAGKEKAIKVVDDQIGCPTYTIDLAEAIKFIVLNFLESRSSERYGIYHVTNSGSCSWFEYAKEIVAVKQLETQVVPIHSQESGRLAPRPKISILDNSKLKAAFNLELRPWQEAVRHFLQNYS